MILQQVFFNAVVSGAEYTLLGVSFALVYRTLKFFHFAHGVIFTFGAYCTFALRIWFGVPLFPAALASMAISAALGCIIDAAVFRPLRRRSASAMSMLLASLGTYVVIQNLISMVFGDEAKALRSWLASSTVGFLGAEITGLRLVIIAAAFCTVGLAVAGLTRTKVGMMVRAFADDGELARIAGIESEPVILCVFAFASAIAALAGTLVALDINMFPTMGMTPFMMAVVAAIIGGVKSFPGVAFGALLVGVVQQLTIWLLSSLWQGAIVFALVIVFLLVRPRGFGGARLRSTNV